MWDAACAGADPELFFPAKRGAPEIRAAKSVCARCPVRDECLEYSLRTEELFGIWGGLDEWERQELLGDQEIGDGGQDVA